MSKVSLSVSVFVLGGRLGEDEFASYLRSLDANLARGKPFAMVVDGSAPGLGIVEVPNQRWQLSRAQAIGQLHRGIAFVTGTMTRERVRALYALQPPAVPYGFFNERADAMVWAQAALDGEHKVAMGARKTQPLMRATS
jgi:hypothetical protein